MLPSGVGKVLCYGLYPPQVGRNWQNMNLGLPIKSGCGMDGMAAANGRLYLATKYGRILCFAGNE